jgi:hypothetical protein
MRLENGDGASMENLLRVARALGVLDILAAAIDPFDTAAILPLTSPSAKETCSPVASIPTAAGGR